VDDSRNLNAAQVIHEDAKKARVVVRGMLNGSQPFTLERTATGSKSSLSVVVDGQELTQQEQKLTEGVIRDQFSSTLLPKTLFFGQEQLMELILVRICDNDLLRWSSTCVSLDPSSAGAVERHAAVVFWDGA
jgi:cation transport ATPase